MVRYHNRSCCTLASRLVAYQTHTRLLISLNGSRGTPKEWCADFSGTLLQMNELIMWVEDITPQLPAKRHFYFIQKEIKQNS